MKQENTRVNDPQLIRTDNVFTMTCGVKVDFQASAAIVWSLLTHAQGVSRWNCTVTRIDGHIRDGGRLKLHIPGTKRIFTPMVSGVVPARRMTWRNGYAPIFKSIQNLRALAAKGTTAFVRCYGVALHHRNATPQGNKTRAFVGTYELRLILRATPW